MLVLSRKKNETVIIGDGPGQIVVTVNKVTGNRVSLGFTAADGIRIVRGELEVEVEGNEIAVEVVSESNVKHDEHHEDHHDEPRIPNVEYRGPDVSAAMPRLAG